MAQKTVNEKKIKRPKDEIDQFTGEVPKKKSKLKWIVLLALLLILAAFVVAFVMNLFNIRTSLVRIVVAQDPEYQTMFNELQTKSEELDELRTQIEVRQQELVDFENSLTNREQELDNREASIAEDQAAAEAEIEAARSSGDSVAQMAKIYEDMDAQDAAQVLVALGDDQKVADMLMSMDSTKAGLILQEMSTTNAAKISRLMT